ncbi:hypothetical protein NECAME_15651 [Necator americanus]|uniref:ATP-dependent DNA helicase n=1 Tax=Necator americanus TaxID=51031 RepID=W2SJ70_NECAM|nr:hypothetical protein NECAME_15651 [Necator americanus]ETN68767.1 hypothetical protein NECAME_15651 [Necator americanus]
MTSSLRQQAVRQNESAERRSERLAANSLRQHRRRQAETVEERSERLFENSQRQQRRRQTEGAEERAVRLSENAQRQHRRRQNEDAARRSERLILNGKRQRRQSLNDDHEHRIHRLHADAERQRRRRRAPLETIGLALRTRTAETNYLGEMNCRCMNCGARHFQFEVKQQYPGIFGDCCNHDRIVFDLFEEFQEPLKQLFLRESSASLEHRQRHRNFLENIRNFNSTLAIICCDPELMRFLSEWFAQNNAYARSFKLMSEVERAEKEATNRDNRRPTTIRMVFEENSGRNIARGQYAMPTANEVAVVYVGEENDVPPARSLAVSLRESLMNISDMDKRCDLLTYPLLFPTGRVSAVKYLYKYIYKGPDRARITIESDSDDSGNGVVDEIKQHLNTRYVCPPQALHRVFGFAMQEKSHAVCRLAVHLPGYQTVHFVAGQAVDGAHSNFTSLTAYFELNRSCANVFDNGLQSDTNIDARELFYYRIPEHFSFTARHGGSGKAYLYNTIYNMAMGQRRQVLCVAWIGIAPNLLPNGRTVTSAFKLNMADENRTSLMKRQQKEARQLKNDRPFGGKPFIIGGDFRQVLPIVEHGQCDDFVNSCVTNSVLWSLFKIYRLDVNMRTREVGLGWANFLLEVDNGTANDKEGRIQILKEFRCQRSIVTEIFGETIDPNDTNLCERATLAPMNLNVRQLNNEAFERLCTFCQQDERVYKSVDEAVYYEGSSDELYPVEYLNTLEPTGMPPHELL